LLAGWAGPGTVVSPVRIGGSGWIADAPTKIADALDYFNHPATGGTTPAIEVEYYDSGKQALEAMLAGKVEFALAATVPLASALMTKSQAALEPVILASVALSNQSHVVVTASGGRIVEPADLEGRRVGMLRGTSAEYAWSRFVALHGVDPNSVEVVDMPVSSLVDATLAGSIDAAVLWDPWAARLQARLGDDGTVFSTRSLHTVNWLLLTRRSRLRESPAVADRVVRGLLRAVELIHHEPDRARRLHSELGGVPLEVLAPLEDKVIWNVGLDWSVLANMQAQFTWLRSKRHADGLAVPSPDRYLEPSVLARVAPERVHLPPYLYTGRRGNEERP